MVVMETLYAVRCFFLAQSPLWQVTGRPSVKEPTTAPPRRAIPRAQFVAQKKLPSEIVKQTQKNLTKRQVCMCVRDEASVIFLRETVAKGRPKTRFPRSTCVYACTRIGVLRVCHDVNSLVICIFAIHLAASWEWDTSVGGFFLLRLPAT